MALNEKRTWLITYDISCPRRLGRVYRYLKTIAVPVQYSVFAVEGSPQEIQHIRDTLAQDINTKNDDVRIYPLPHNLELHHYGRRSLPEGLQLLADRHNLVTGDMVTNQPTSRST